MKFFPCNSRECSGKPAQTKSGRQMLVGSFPDKETIYKCWRCKKATVLRLAEWARLPDATEDEVVGQFPSTLDISVQ